MYQLRKKKSCRYCCHLWSRQRTFQATHVYATLGLDGLVFTLGLYLKSPAIFSLKFSTFSHAMSPCMLHILPIKLSVKKFMLYLNILIFLHKAQYGRQSTYNVTQSRKHTCCSVKIVSNRFKF